MASCDGLWRQPLSTPALRSPLGPASQSTSKEAVDVNPANEAVAPGSTACELACRYPMPDCRQRRPANSCHLGE
jgi:hypothetical protein